MALPISSAKMGSVLGVPSSSSSYQYQHHYQSNSQQQHYPAVVSNANSSSSGNTLVNNNNTTGNFSDLGDSPFENNTFTSITVPVGDSAFLKCTVKNLGNRTVRETCNYLLHNFSYFYVTICPCVDLICFGAKLIKSQWTPFSTPHTQKER